MSTQPASRFASAEASHIRVLGVTAGSRPFGGSTMIEVRFVETTVVPRSIQKLLYATLLGYSPDFRSMTRAPLRVPSMP